ncbi:MAG: glutamate synthase-related protein, partial [Bacteriovoracaceae bacterium]
QNLRSLFKFKFSKNPSSADSALLEKEILKRFGSGAMSFGALSAESQRDLILAFKNVGGRANSGEGGENPYYFKEGISANVKQIASGRFGVTAEYLINSDEVQIKIAQGAKPGEGGQLPGHKVNTQIAKARFSKEGIGLISPPPMHDIYSIEDLKQLIYELKQFHPKAKVSVKLVSALTIGPIAVGVAKAGADVIQISGGDGGTGAASQLSMKHAGLPWEFGLWISHLALKESNLREVVKLRTDGGLQVGEDVAKAFLFGADEVDFGKSALIAQGCIMARVCHKNTCPAGIATQDEKFKARYKGNVSDVEKWLRRLAKETANILMNLNVQDLNQAIGNISFLQKAELPAHLKNLDLNFFSESSLKEPPPGLKAEIFWQHRKDQFLPNHLNQKIVDQFKEGEEFDSFYPINSLDRAVPGTLMGEIGKLQTKKRTDENVTLPEIKMNFIGHAGQGFGVFLSGNTKLNLKGFANDFVGKSMNDGEIVINPSLKGRDLFRLRSVAIGNCALYGATGGNLFVLGQAGDRFAVRNSGAETIIGGIGHHGCEYMTGGKVIVLDTVVANLGAGMSGGEIFIQRREGLKIHDGSVCVKALNNKDYEYLLSKLSLYERYFDINLGIEKLIPEFVKVVPK